MKDSLHLTHLTNEQADSRARVLAHLRKLSDDDLTLRFGMARVKDETLANYVRGLDLEHDMVLGIEDSNGEVIAVAHAARYDVHLSGATEARAEVSFSVVPAYRGQGLARLLMFAIIQAASEAGIQKLFAQCVAANRPMRSLFAGTGWVLDVEDGEVLAKLPLCPSQKNNNLNVASSIP